MEYYIVGHIQAEFQLAISNASSTTPIPPPFLSLNFIYSTLFYLYFFFFCYASPATLRIMSCPRLLKMLRESNMSNHHSVGIHFLSISHLSHRISYFTAHFRTCDTCGDTICHDNISSSHSSGVSKGALAGAVIAILAFIAIVLAVIWRYQKRAKSKRALEARALEPKDDVPASAAAVLSRPDPVEKPRTPVPGHVRVFSGHSDTTINLHSSSARTQDNDTQSDRPSTNASSPIHNPFADDGSLRSASEQGSSMIPITVLPYGSVQSPSTESSQSQQLDPRANAISPVPSRPVRSPELNLRIDGSHPNAPPSSFDLTHVNISNDSVPIVGGRPVPSIRSDVSHMSAGSHASYLSTGTYATDLFTESPTIVTRQQGRILGFSKAQVVEVPSSFSSAGSPLASSHLTPTVSRLSRLTSSRSIRSPLAQQSFTPADIIEMAEQPETSPFADTNAERAPLNPLGDELSVRSTGTYGSQASPWAGGDDTDSIASGIEASITSAKRVVVGSNGRVASQSSAGAVSHASRLARNSFTSEASSRADSILEAFPFVPPSPHSTQSFRSAIESSNPSAPVVSSSSVAGTTDLESRRQLGLSTFSQSSTALSGLESFPFQLQIDSGNADSQQKHIPQRTDRASLDTLALSRDLTAFPLAYDEDTETSSRVKYVDPSRKSSTTRARN